MSLKGLEHVIRQNSMTLLLDQLMGNAGHRQWLGNELGQAKHDPLDIPLLINDFATHIGAAASTLNLSGREDLTYSLDKMLGTGTIPGQGRTYHSDPYWNYVPLGDRLETLKQALIAIVTLGKPTQTFWLTLDDRKEPVDRGFLRNFFSWTGRHAPDIGFRVQITDAGPNTVVHIITPYPARDANSMAGSLNQALRSWVIGSHQVIQAQAQKMNRANQISSNRGRLGGATISGTFAATPLTTPGSGPQVSQVQLRYYDQAFNGRIPANNQPIL